jgi:hypothetical protein
VPPARCQLGGLLPPAEQPVLSVGQSDLRRALLCPRHAPQTALVERQLDRLGLAARSDVDVRVVGAPEDAPRLTSRAVAASDRPPDGAAGARSLRLGERVGLGSRALGHGRVWHFRSRRRRGYGRAPGPAQPALTGSGRDDAVGHDGLGGVARRRAARPHLFESRCWTT